MNYQQPCMDYKLVNFNVPNHFINSFDEMCKFKRISRTHILNRLMEVWLRNEVKQLEEDNKFNHLIRDMKLRNRDTSPLQKQKESRWEDDEDILPPPIINQYDNDDWESRLLNL